MVLLNLISEGWIEEVFNSLHKRKIAPQIFSIILEDEHRHVTEAKLYRTIGLPNQSILIEKLALLENFLFTNLFMQPKYLLALGTLLGVDYIKDLVSSLNKKHKNQLKKIELTPSKECQFLMEMNEQLCDKLACYIKPIHEIPLTPTRKVFMTQWNEPGDPTMVAQWDLDVSCLLLEEKKYPSETLTTLILQAMSLVISQNESFRNFLSHHKMYRSNCSYTSIIIKLPKVTHHIGQIIFQDCHLISAPELSAKIKTIIALMSFCYEEREKLEKKYPFLQEKMDKLLYEFAHDVYAYPIPGTPVASLSNIGFCGFSQAVSPLRKREVFKLTLLTVEHKLVWDKIEKKFVERDMLPISLSADHRVLDANLPVPQLLETAFQYVFGQFLQNSYSFVDEESKKLNEYKNNINHFLKNNLEARYQVLCFLQNVWLDFINIDELFALASQANEELSDQLV